VGFRVTDSNSVGSSEGVTFAEIYFTFTISEAINILSVNEGHVETGREEVVQLFVSPTFMFLKHLDFILSQLVEKLQPHKSTQLITTGLLK